MYVCTILHVSNSAISFRKKKETAAIIKPLFWSETGYQNDAVDDVKQESGTQLEMNLSPKLEIHHLKN